MTEISSEGTPIDALESGNVPNSADAARMAQIMQDINASGGEIAGAGGPVQNELMPQQPRQAPSQMLPPHSGIPMDGMTGQMPAMVQQAPRTNSQFVPYDDEHAHGGSGPRKNAWGTFMERLTDPLVVAVLIFVLSLPALQTFGSKYAPWAFAIGGQLSWLGLISKAVFGGLLFWLFKMASAFL
jgi:hypothetical protein